MTPNRSELMLADYNVNLTSSIFSGITVEEFYLQKLVDVVSNKCPSLICLPFHAQGS